MSVCCVFGYHLKKFMPFIYLTEIGDKNADAENKGFGDADDEFGGCSGDDDETAPIRFADSIRGLDSRDDPASQKRNMDLRIMIFTAFGLTLRQKTEHMCSVVRTFIGVFLHTDIRVWV